MAARTASFMTLREIPMNTKTAKMTMIGTVTWAFGFGSAAITCEAECGEFWDSKARSVMPAILSALRGLDEFREHSGEVSRVGERD